MANKLGLEAVVASTTCGYMYMLRACKSCVLLSAAPETTEKTHVFSTAKLICVKIHTSAGMKLQYLKKLLRMHSAQEESFPFCPPRCCTTNLISICASNS